MKTNKTRRAPQSVEKSRANQPTSRYVLRLFLAGATNRSRQAVLRVRQLCAAELKDHFKLEVIDICRHPNLARDNDIVATPTLVKEFPRPVRRFIGDLSNTTRLFVELGLLTKGKW